MTLAESLRDCSAKEHVQRITVIEEAISWLNTPFISEARVKGIGADCAEFPAGVFINAGLIAAFKVEHLPAMWHLHATEEEYIKRISVHLTEFDGPPLPGDVALFHVKKAYAHSGIVVEWPNRIIHCLNRGGVQWGDASRDAFLIMEQRQFPPKFFSFWKNAPTIQ